MSEKPVKVVDVVSSEILSDIAKKIVEPIELKNKDVTIKAKELPLPANAASETTLTEILKKLNSVLVVDNSNSIQPVSIKDAKLAPNAATEQTLQKIIEVLSKPAPVLERVKVSGAVSIDNFPSQQTSISVNNFPTESTVRVNSSVLAPNAATEKTLNDISEKLKDKVEVKGKLEVFKSELPINAATESTLNDIKAMLKVLVDLELEEERSPEHFTLEQAALGIDVQKAKFISIQVDDRGSSQVSIKASNTNEQYHVVNTFSQSQICVIEPKFKYLQVEACKSAKISIVVFYN